MKSPSELYPKTIELYGIGTQHEAVADGAILPGHFLQRTVGDVPGKSVAVGQGGAAHVANEYDLTGKGIDDAYADGDQVVFTTYMPGASVYAVVADGAAAITEGDFLSVQADGTLGAAAGSTIAQALESVDNSAGAEYARIRVEITTGLPV